MRRHGRRWELPAVFLLTLLLLQADAESLHLLQPGRCRRGVQEGRGQSHGRASARVVPSAQAQVCPSALDRSHLSEPAADHLSLCVCVPSAAWTSRSHAGAETRCVPGSRTRVWVCTWTRLRAGSSPDRRCCRRRSMTWRRWDGPGGPGRTAELRLNRKNTLCYRGYTRVCLLCRS